MKLNVLVKRNEFKTLIMLVHGNMVSNSRHNENGGNRIAWLLIQSARFLTCKLTFPRRSTNNDADFPCCTVRAYHFVSGKPAFVAHSACRELK